MSAPGMSVRSHSARRVLTGTLGAFALSTLMALLNPGAAKASDKFKRKGGQAELMAGGSFCVPGGKVKCSDEQAGDIVDGGAAPSFGMGFNLGYRFNKWFLLGAGYSVGWFDTDYTVGNDQAYRSALQHTVVGVLRAYIPIWRFDIGFEASPGWSRQVFYPDANPKQYTQGFVFRPGLVVDFFITRQIFLGAKADVMLNVHNNVCVEEGNTTTCQKKSSTDVAGFHQAILGVHFGGTF